MLSLCSLPTGSLEITLLVWLLACKYLTDYKVNLYLVNLLKDKSILKLIHVYITSIS